MTKLKYLWAIALVALCLSVGSGAAFSATGDSWTALSQTFLGTIEWDTVFPNASVQAGNNGTTSWNSTFGLESVEGVTTAAIPIDRWGLTLVPIVGVTVPPGSSFLFSFALTGPPITSLKYNLPVTPTEPSDTVARFDSNWILARDITPTSTPTSGTLITTDTAQAAVVVSRFPDDQPTGSALSDQLSGSWARFWIEELAGKVPLVVKGFPEPTGPPRYRPLVQVTRDQMAVFMQRALKLPLVTPVGLFTDVSVEGKGTPPATETFWAAAEIETLVGTNIVKGFDEPDATKTYRPALVVTRDQMAVFVARGIAGGDSLVPTGPATATFPDVQPTGDEEWAFKYIEFAVDEGVVQGFPEEGGSPTYRPLLPLDRAQMAVFIWRSFVMPSNPGSVVVLSGPAFTSADVENADFIGFSSIGSGPQAHPGFAYVGFDAVRLGFGLINPQTPSGEWDVLFELIPEGKPTPIASKMFGLDEADIADARDAAFATGDPYFFLSWELPSGLAKGNYMLTVSAADETGALFEIARKPAFTIE
jgi:hypothetical protein